jgi:hypothetical protein
MITVSHVTVTVTVTVPTAAMTNFEPHRQADIIIILAT